MYLVVFACGCDYDKWKAFGESFEKRRAFLTRDEDPGGKG